MYTPVTWVTEHVTTLCCDILEGLLVRQSNKLKAWEDAQSRDVKDATVSKRESEVGALTVQYYDKYMYLSLVWEEV